MQIAPASFTQSGEMCSCIDHFQIATISTSLFSFSPSVEDFWKQGSTIKEPFSHSSDSEAVSTQSSKRLIVGRMEIS